MPPARKDSASGDDFFSSSTTFDIEGGTPQKRRRRTRDGSSRAQPIQRQAKDSQRPSRQSSPLEHDEIEVQDEALNSCPGCGSDVDEGEYVDVLVSFVTGAADYLAGDPVRTQAVQALKQQAKALELPEPYEDWLLEVCTRLEAQVVRYVEARRDLIRAELEEHLRKELIGDLYEQIRGDIEAQVRQDIETEMWEKFEQLYRDQKDS
jgi:hypothetical protein